MLVWFSFTVSFQLAELILSFIITFFVLWLNYNSFLCYEFKLFHPMKTPLIFAVHINFAKALIKSNLKS